MRSERSPSAGPARPGSTPAADAVDFARRERLEQAAAGHVHAATEAALGAVGLTGRLVEPEVVSRAEQAVRLLLRAVLSEMVQGGLSVEDAARLATTVADAGTTVPADELLRAARTTGVDVVVQALRGEAGLTRREEARLRDAAVRLVSSVTVRHHASLPTDTEVLRRLRSSGSDLR